MSQIVKVYDELDREYVVEVEGASRVVRVISAPPTLPEPESQASQHADAGWMNDVRFGG